MTLMQEKIIAVVTFIVCTALMVSSAAAQGPSPTFRSETNVVLVPTLVMKKSGQILYGLTAKDFIVEDDGVEQTVQIDESPEQEAISLVVAIQVGRSASLHFYAGEDECSRKFKPGFPERKTPPTMSGLGAMLDSFIGESKGEIAVVTFDSKVRLFQDFKPTSEEVSERLKCMYTGDGGAAILDAVRYSLDLLDKRPKNHRRILLLISESRDHGSRVATLEDVVQRVALSNSLVYSVTFSPSRAELVRDVKGDSHVGSSANLLAPIMLGINGMRRNMARAIAEMTGGESATFKNRHTFDASLDKAASHARNRYQLSFQPKSPRPGPHVLTVKLRNPQRGVVVIARSSYWAVKAGE